MGVTKTVFLHTRPSLAALRGRPAQKSPYFPHIISMDMLQSSRYPWSWEWGSEPLDTRLATHLINSTAAVCTSQFR